MFRITWKSLVAISILTASVFFLLSMLSPEGDVKSKVDGSPDLFQVVTQATLVFGASFDGAPKENRHQITLPFSRIDKLQGFNPEHVWIEFLIDRDIREQGRFLFLPRTWGEVKIFRNGIKVVDGKNLDPEVELVSGKNVIRVHSDLRDSARNSPLTALFRPFIAVYRDGYQIRATLWSQSSVKERTTVFFLYALFIFSVIYLADAKKSELFFLIFYLVVHLVRNQLAIVAENNFKITNYSFLQGMLIVGPEFLLGIVLLAFLAAFVRLSNQRIRRILLFSIAASPFSIGISYFVIRQFLFESNRSQVFLICITLHSIASYLLLLGRDAAFLVNSRSVPRHRRVAVAMVFSVVIAVYIFNFLDFVELTNAITTEYRNSLFLVLLICATAGFEFAADTDLALAGRVASQAAHDIRAPLAALRSLAGTDVALTPEIQKTITEVIGRIRFIAEDLLDIEGSSKQLSSNPQPVSVSHLTEMIEQVLEEKRAMCGGSSSISMKNLIGNEQRLFSTADRGTLARIFSIVLDNAFEAAKGNLGEIDILIDYDKKRDELIFLISDNGCGMTTEHLQNLGRRGFSDKILGSRGHGLGVQYVFSRLRDLGGAVEYKSEVGKGTIVSIRLPIFKEEMNGECVIILIDDDELVRLAWQKVARRRGISFRAFSSVEEFNSCIGEINKDWPIYIDAHLESASGVHFAKTLAKAGFSKLFIATGDYSLRKINEPWLQGVVGKDPPWI